MRSKGSIRPFVVGVLSDPKRSTIPNIETLNARHLGTLDP